MSSLNASFSQTYKESRDKFIEAVRGAGGELTSIEHPDKGPDGEDLFMDFAVLGPGDAINALVIVSGTHGPEGFCGAACQIQLLSDKNELQKYSDLRLIFVHAHNPYGFAWMRRVNEDNVDINRNYADFTQPLDINEDYSMVHDLIVPESLDDAAYQAMAEWAQEYGKDRFYNITLSGQRVEPSGMFYGGVKPSWSNIVMRANLPKMMESQKRAFVIDFHTGLGPFGQGDIFSPYSKSSKEHLFLSSCFDGQAIATTEGELDGEVDYEAKGPLICALDSILPDHETVGVVVEYGTVEMERIFNALLAENWFQTNPGLRLTQAETVKREMQACFYPDDPEWKTLVWDRAIWIMNKAAVGLRLPDG